MCAIAPSSSASQIRFVKRARSVSLSPHHRGETAEQDKSSGATALLKSAHSGENSSLSRAG